MTKYKQVICVRKDLTMRKGKIASQVAHASCASILDHMTIKYKNKTTKWDMQLNNSHPMALWLNNSFTKVAVYVNSLEEMLQLKAMADLNSIQTTLITDSGKTEFNGVPTETVLAIGPGEAYTIDKITGHLKLI